MPDAPPAPFDYAATPVAPGRTLVEASAGTGKTFAIAGLVLRLVLEGDWLAPRPGAPPDLRRLLVVTFTNAATDELKTRVRAALRAALRAARGEPVPAPMAPLVGPLAPLLARAEAEPRLLAALDRVDEAGVFTIHRFCRRILEQAAFESGTPFEMEFVEDGDGSALLARAAADAWARLTHADPLLAALAVRRGWTPDALGAHHRAVSEFPDAAVLPETAPLAECLDALRRCTHALRKAWDPDDVAALLDGLDWNKSAPFPTDDLPGLLARVATCADDPDAVDLAVLFDPKVLDGALRKTSRARKERWPEIELHPGLLACADLASALATLGHALTRTFITEVTERVATIKRQRGLLTAGDLVRRLHDALRDPEAGDALARGIRQQFAVALVDEFQDTDPYQYAIFRTAFDGQPLYFVGDPKQAIYGFRGADVHAYLRAQAEADRQFTLGTNWRSTAPLVAAVNAVFAQAPRPFLFDGIPFRPVAAAPANAEPKLAGDDLPPLVWWRIGDPQEGKRITKEQARRDLAAAVACEAGRLLAGGMTLDGRPLAAGDLAVLVPTRHDATPVLEALHKAGIPAVYSGSRDIRDAHEMAEVELLLHAVARPSDERALRAALATELWGWDAAAVAALDADDGGLDALRGRLRDWQRAWRRHGVLHVLARFGQEEAVPDRLLAFADGERRMTNLRHVAELLHETETAAARSPEDLLHWLRHRHAQTLASKDRAELRLERDDAAVHLTTHHNAKGLEYEVVFLPFLWATSQRDTDPKGPTLARTPEGVRYDLGSPEKDRLEALRQTDSLAEHVRTAYVALTRTRQRCYVAWGGANSAEHSGLAYLLGGHTAPGEALPEHVAAARKQARAADPLAPLLALARQHPELMAVVDPPCAPPPARATPEEAAAPRALAARALTPAADRRVRSPWRPVSFTAWAAGARALPTASGPLAAADEPDPEPRRADAPETGIHAFAAGAAAGSCLHEILQAADFRQPEAGDFFERNEEAVRWALGKYGLMGRRRHRGPVEPVAEVLALLRRVAQAPILGSAPLAACAPGASAAEWAFTFPVGHVAPAALAEVFRAHAAPPFRDAYADALAGLDAEAVDGFLSGSADLVAYHDNRWWIADWKSNHLGPDAAAYTPEALARAMTDHHYGLQVHLYTLALHRYLRGRLGAAYAYEEAVGGAVYAFLRGLGEGEAGLFRQRPPAALIDALDDLLAG